MNVATVDPTLSRLRAADIDPLLSVAAVAAARGCSPGTLRNAVWLCEHDPERGAKRLGGIGLHVVRVGRGLAWPESVVRRWLRGEPLGSPSAA